MKKWPHLQEVLELIIIGDWGSIGRKYLKLVLFLLIPNHLLTVIVETGYGVEGSLVLCPRLSVFSLPVFPLINSPLSLKMFPSILSHPLFSASTSSLCLQSAQSSFQTPTCREAENYLEKHNLSATLALSSSVLTAGKLSVHCASSLSARQRELRMV